MSRGTLVYSFSATFLSRLCTSFAIVIVVNPFFGKSISGNLRYGSDLKLLAVAYRKACRGPKPIYRKVRKLQRDRTLPPPGWKSITVPQEIYEFFYKRWKKDKERYRREYGITSFTGFVSKLLNDMLLEYEKRDKDSRPS